MSGSCLEGVWRVSVGCLEGVLKGSGRCLEGVWKVSLRGLGSMQLYASMQICNHACMPVCRYIIVHVWEYSDQTLACPKGETKGELECGPAQSNLFITCSLLVHNLYMTCS